MDMANNQNEVELVTITFRVDSRNHRVGLDNQYVRDLATFEEGEIVAMCNCMLSAIELKRARGNVDPRTLN